METMDEEEKIDFIVSLLENVKDKLLLNITRYPDDWDGIELRWLISEYVEANVIFGVTGHNKKSKRYKEYRNTVLVENLI